MAFYLQVGYSSSVLGTTASCSTPTNSGRGVSLSYSVDGGNTYVLMNTFTISSTFPQEYVYAIPTGAVSASTRFQWWQPGQSSVNNEVWVSFS